MEKCIYTAEHIPVLKKYNFMNMLFLLLGCLVMLLQSIAWLVVWYKDMEINTLNMVFVTITLVFSLFFVMSQVFMYIRNKKIIKTINLYGSFETRRLKIKLSNKHSWGGALRVLCHIFAIIFVVILAAMMFSFVKNYVNWGKVILKVPFMIFCAVSMLNLSAELKIQSLLENSNQ